MKQRKANEADAPSPEQLAAYVDGELDPATRARVAAWLCAHPDAAADLQSLRQLDSLWQETTPPAPARAQWDAVFNRIAARCPAEEPVVASGRAATRHAFGWRWHLRMAGTAAAMLFVTLLLYRPTDPQAQPVPAPLISVVQVLRVAGDEDVEIISMDAVDIGALVVGEPPIRGPFVLAAPGDVVLENIAPDPVDGMKPIAGGMNTNTLDGPMILAPLGVASNR
jgi:hypothetical protein